MAKLQKILRFDGVERAGHWIHLVNMVLLILSGLQIRFPGFNLFGSMGNARLVHFVDMYIFLFIGVFHLYRFFASGKWVASGLTRRNLRGLGGTFKYYLFLTEEEPPAEVYNPLQIISYGLVFAVSALMVIVGFALYWPAQLAVVADAFGGLMTLRQIHYLLAWVFIAFTILHLYLVIFENPRAISKAMFTGSYWKRTGGDAASAD